MPDHRLQAKPADRLGVWHIAEDHPDLIAVRHSPSGPLTFGDLARRAHRVVHALRGIEVRTGDVVAALLPNDAEVFVWWLAAQQAGWSFLPLNWNLAPREIRAILVDSGAAVLVSDARRSELAESGVDGVPLPESRKLAYGGVAGFAPVEELLASAPETVPADRSTGRLLAYTSGTTGRPRGVLQPQQAGDPSEALHQDAAIGRGFRFGQLRGTHLVAAAVHHVAVHIFSMAALNCGQSLVIMPKFEAETALRNIEEFDVTTTYMVPTMFHRLLQLPEEARSRYRIDSLETVVHSGAACPRSVKQQMMAWWGPVIWELYGGSERPGTVAKPDQWLARPGTVGRAIPGIGISICDERGAAMGPGEAGLVYLESDGPAFEYHRDPAATAEAVVENRVTLGDIGYLDEDGYLFICDRAKDMIVTGGVNVYSAEVESAILEHPDVADVAVIGVPDDEWGEVVRAVVVPVDGVVASPDLAREIRSFLRGRLASFKCPRTIDFAAELPRTDSGKLYKRLLRDQYRQLAGEEATVDFQQIKYRVADGTARITLSRPKVLNALSFRMRQEMIVALRAAESDEQVSAILIDADGPSFCAGYDLTEGLGLGSRQSTGDANGSSPGYADNPDKMMGEAWVTDPDLETWTDQFARSCVRDWMTMWDLLKPVVAKVHGNCLGGGFEVASMADIVFAADDARFGYPPMRGIATPDVPFFPWKLSMARAKYLQITGNSITGAQAAEWGLIAKSFPADELDARVDDEVAAISAVAPDLLMANKHQVNSAYEMMGMRTHLNQSWSWHHLTAAVRPNYKSFFRVAKRDGLKAAFDWMNQPFSSRGIR